MAELFVSKEAQKYSENLISQYLRDSGYEGSMEDGTGLYDTVIRPSALIYTLLRQDIDRVYAYLSIDKANELRDAISEDDYDAAIDGILSNWFVTRNEGTAPAGTVRMFFSRTPEFLIYTAGEQLGTVGSVAINAVRTVAFAPTDYSSVVNTTDNITEYYVDIPAVAAEVGSDAILADTTISAVSKDIYFLRATIPADFTKGTERESSEDFIARTREAITTRELITDRAIHTVLPNEFPELRSLYVAGHGEPEMIRDIVSFQNVVVHVGNMADIWVGSSLVDTEEKVVVDESGVIALTNSPVHIVSITDDLTGQDIPFSLVVDEDRWLIPGEQPLDIAAYFPVFPIEDDTAEEPPTERTITVREITSHLPGEIAKFVFSADNRVASYDPQVKMKVPVIMRFDLSVMSDSTTDVTAEAIKAAVTSYVDSLHESGEVWVESEMIKHIHNVVPAVIAIRIPTTCTATFFDMGTSDYVTVQANNKFVLPPSSKQITANTVQYYTAPEFITVSFI